MRRTFRAAATRLVVVLLATLLAAPQAMAASSPSRDSVGTQRADAPTKQSKQLINRGSIDLSNLAARPATPRPIKALPRLPAQSQAGQIAGVPKGLAAAPALPGPAPVPATVLGAATHPPIVTPTFNGLSFGTPDTSFEPPDPWVAVGPNHVVQVVNTAMRITTRQGGHIDTFSLADFFVLPLNPETFNFDPRVIYDSLHGRWIATELSFDCAFNGEGYGTGYLDIARSDTADPLGGWRIRSIPFPMAIPDYPMVGTSTDKVAIGSNVFGLSGSGSGCAPNVADWRGTVVDVVDWAQLVGVGIPALVEISMTNFRSTARPALAVPATSPVVHGVSMFLEGPEFHPEYFSITGNAANDSILVSVVDLTDSNEVGGFGLPPAPIQPTEPGPDPAPNGEITDAVDGRPTDALWQNGRLVWVSTIECTLDAAVRDCVRVTELNTATIQRRQDFLIGEVGKDIFHGGIGLSMNGALHVTYTRSSLTDPPGTHAVYQLPGDATNAVSPDEEVRPGEGPYNIGERWGDYTGVAQDPQDPNVVWQTNEVPRADGAWLTHISSLSTAVGGTYFPITPYRVLDTRDGTGGYSDKFRVNQPRTIGVGGVGPIPADAVAVTGNLTVARQTGAGHFALSPQLSNPPTSSIINFPVGDVRANNLTFPLGAAGYVHAWYVAPAGSRSDLVFDVTGYFKANDTGATYNPLDPSRILDTRTGIGLSGPYRRDIPRSFQVSGHGGVPTGAVAVTGNLTVAGQTASGHVALTPTPNPNPSTSTLNFPVLDNRANGLTIPLSPTGKIAAVYKSSVAGSTTNLIFDVTGYYLPGTTGLRFYTLNPGRRMDTRTTVLTGLTGTFSANTSRVLDTAGFMGVPPNAAAITGNLTVTQPTKAGHLAVTPSVILNPPTSTVNFPIGDTRANGVTQPLNGAGDIAIYFKAASGGTVHAILDVTGYFR